MEESVSRSNVINTLYKERTEFIILGVTGRTGTGCSEVSKLLEKDFISLEVPKIKDLKDVEGRQYDIVYNFAKENWKPFIRIEMKHVIFTFILEHTYDVVENFMKEFGITNELESIKDEYEKFSTKRLDYMKKVNNSNENGEMILADEKIYKFYFEEIPSFYIKFQACLENSKKTIYTEIMQKIGNNVRASGDAMLSEIKSEDIFKLSQRLNMFIKILRKRNLKEKGSVLIVIDAFRNPFEATFFKDRYSSFYLISVNSLEFERKERLQKKGISISDIEKLDKSEYPKRHNEAKDFFVIDIEKTIELADIHINNFNTETGNYDETKKQLIRYISLIMHPALVTPTKVERSMQLAINSKMNSGCLSRQVGAVITDDQYDVISIGWNSTPNNQFPCNLRDIRSLVSGEQDDEIGMSDYERTCYEYKNFLKEKTSKVRYSNLSGRYCSYCFKDAYNSFTNKKNQVHTRSIHAEEMAFLKLSKSGGNGVRGGYLFTTASPCELCSKKAFHTGIKKIYYIDQYPGISLQHVLGCGKERPEMILFNGAVGRAYNQFYTQILSFKDELYMLLDLEF